MRFIVRLIIALSTGVGWDSAQAQTSTADLVQRAQKAVVTVYASDAEGRSQGTGFFVGSDGKLLTNQHVIDGASILKVVLHDGSTTVPATVLYANKEWDIAVLRADLAQAPAFLPVSEERPRPGDRILVIGSPMGLSQSVSDGIVSAIRELEDGLILVQITAPISKGSSGSPVINERGNAVGVATFLLKSGQNLNFAVSTQVVKKIVKARTFTPPGEKTGGTNSARTNQQELAEAVARVKNNPMDLDGYLELAKVYERQRRLDRAIESMNLGIALNSTRPVDFKYLAELLQKSGKTEEAISTLEQGLRVASGELSLKSRLAFYLSSSAKASDQSRAVDIYREILKQKSDPEILMGLGSVLSRSGRKSEAAAIYREVIEFNPDSRNAVLELSALLERKEAETLFAEYARRFPQSPYFKYILGKLLVAKGDKPEAIRLYDDLRKQDEPLASALFTLIFPR